MPTSDPWAAGVVVRRLLFGAIATRKVRAARGKPMALHPTQLRRRFKEAVFSSLLGRRPDLILVFGRCLLLEALATCWPAWRRLGAGTTGSTSPVLPLRRLPIT